MMECIPAIDLRAGQAVRLLRGDYGAETGFGDPLQLAAEFLAAGATRLHLVDLDAARSGTAANRDLVVAITATAAALGVPVQFGGGVRSEETAAELFSVGVDRVVLGTAAMQDPGLAWALAEAFPGRVLVGLDHRRAGARREVAVQGWTTGAGRELTEALALFEDAPLAGVVVTDIGRDGTLEGPDLDGYRDVLGATQLAVIASGGVGEAAHLGALAAIEVKGRRLAGVVVGRALLAGRLRFEDAVAACGR